MPTCERHAGDRSSAHCGSLHSAAGISLTDLSQVIAENVPRQQLPSPGCGHASWPYFSLTALAASVVIREAMSTPLGVPTCGPPPCGALQPRPQRAVLHPPFRELRHAPGAPTGSRPESEID